MDKSTLQFGDSAIVAHHQGAHLSSWLYKGQEQLFLSRNAVFKPSKAIRGGVPLCFPQFGAFGQGKQHGFARNVLWQKVNTSKANLLRFELGHSKESLSLWPYEFKAQFDIELDQNMLSMCLKVENLSNKAMEFTCALHSYFRVSDIENASVKGLAPYEFWDNGTPFSQRQSQEESLLTVNQMIDRVYFNSLEPLKLLDDKSARIIESQGFADTVIWNPWLEGASDLADMANDEYKQMLCIESANVQTPIQIEEGGVWQGSQKVTVDEFTA